MGLIILAYFGLYLYEVQEVPVILDVEKGVAGITVDTDALRMGTIAPGQTSQRKMDIVLRKPSRVVVAFSGETAPFMRAEPATAVGEAGERIKVTFTAFVPSFQAEGHYEGKAIIRFYRRWF
ncbi:hypothetical protein D6789_04460 [Candidatus Woesearchaeota archaeon]|nr:MAG: hypothetical protein D6789_04460 [Candidatus Woesearchaeota archaeon]